MKTGMVKMFNADRGFGFITPDGSDQDLFVHIHNVDESLDELVKGQRVKFNEGPSRKNPGQFEAINVVLS